MSIEVKIVCPLGKVCEEVVDGKIHRCAWYVELEGENPNTGDVVRESKCAMAWQPILAIETTREAHRSNVGIQSLRNETTKRQNIALEVMKNAKIASDK